MATVTGLTAERMLAIEAESIIDGDVVGNNLILKRHDGVTIDAGPVKGPKGDTGSSGISVAQNNLPVLDVGIAGQIRAGRQLTVADFTRMGLQTPVGLFNLSDLSNLGSGGPLSNEGSVPFGVGINGLAATCAVFAGSAAQGLYITDAAGGAFNPKTLTLGGWFRTAKRGTAMQAIAGKCGPGASSATGSYLLYINSNNQVQAWVTNGANDANAIGISDVCDDRWHFAAMTWDGTYLRLYIDGVLEATAMAPVALIQPQQINEPFSIGCSDADAASNSNLFWGRIDEVFFTSEVLSEDQTRLLYCAKIAHGGSSTPINALVNVHRRRKGALFTIGDFSAQPRRLYNFTNGALTDEGVDNAALTANGGPLLVAGADGGKSGAFQFDGNTQWFSAPAAGLPSGVADRTVGAWFKSTDDSGGIVALSGTGAGNDVRYLYFGGSAPTTLRFYDGTTVLDSFRAVSDGLWHFGVVVLQNAPADGQKVKLYCDGKLIATSTGLASTNAGLGLDIGRQAASAGATDRFAGAIDSVFVTDYAMNPELIRSLYAKGAQDLGASPKNPGDHIESMDASNVYATFDTLESQNLVDLSVAA